MKYLTVIGAVLIIVLISASTVIYVKSKQRPSVYYNESKSTIVNTPIATPKTKTAVLTAVGDMLVHDTVYNDFRVGQTDTFDFKPAFERIKPIIQKGDFNIVNQETILGGVSLGLSGLYVANSPQELGEAFVDTGFNLIQMANNHAMDRGVKGIENTLSFWKKYEKDIITSGVYSNNDDRYKIPIKEINGIRVAFLTYTYGSNKGMPQKPYSINLIDSNLIKADVESAKKISDVIVVGLHWGIEKQRQPSNSQRLLAQELANAGVDIIYGTHPHVLQPPEWVNGKNGNRTYVMYSLGNFISIHTELIPYTLTGAIMGLQIIKYPDGSIKLDDPFAIPTWNYYKSNETGFKVVPFSEMNQEIYRWGNWKNHTTETESFLKKHIPELDTNIKDSILGIN